MINYYDPDTYIMSRKEKVLLLIAQDIVEMQDEMLAGVYTFIQSALLGENWMQYNDLTDRQVDNEYMDRIDNIKTDERIMELSTKLSRNLFPSGDE
jgi:hypothetical protein